MHLAGNIDLVHGAVGGIAIGSAATALMLTQGKVAGLSGILEGMLIFRPNDNKRWCWSFITGLVSSGAVLAIYYPQSFSSSTVLKTDTIVIAGIITGFGTRLGSGCTSGHGICGLPRFSYRSLLAVCTFMCTGVLSAYLCYDTPIRDVLLRSELSNKATPAEEFLPPAITALVCILFFSYNHWFKLVGLQSSESAAAGKPTTIAEYVNSYIWGMVFGLGLGVSGMCNPARVINFLNFSGSNGWDPSLMAVMGKPPVKCVLTSFINLNICVGGGVLLNILTFQWLSRQTSRPLLCAEGSCSPLSSLIKMGRHPDNLKVDWKLITGSALFGIG